MGKVDKAKTLEQIAKSLEDSNCPLRPGAQNPVPGEGNADADVLFIGEAPGKQEDETGRPFVGAAGKELAKLLESIGLKREDVFITSIEKFRPPKNRMPTKKEIDACFPYLEKQILVIRPKLIVTLGAPALKTLLAWQGEKVGAISMQKMHGQTMVLPSGYKCLPVHHPAAVFYNRRLHQTMQEDFKKIHEALR